MAAAPAAGAPCTELLPSLIGWLGAAHAAGAAALLARVFLVVFAVVLLFIVGISGWWTGHLGAVTTTSPTGHDGWG